MNPETVEAGSVYLDAGATAIDNIDGDVTAGIVTVTSVDTSALGAYAVTYDVTDASGNQAVQVTRTVNVVDTTPPVITLLGSETETINWGESYVDAGATASDNLDGDITASIVVLNDVNPAVLGTYAVIYRVTDTSGNPAEQVFRTVIVSAVEDTTRPVITLLGINPVNVEVETPYVDAGATASDDLDGDITSKIVTVNPVDISVPGSYSVTYDVTDNSGNRADQVIRTVNVMDNTPPVPGDESSCEAVDEIAQSECQALVALYDSTAGPGWLTNTGWLETDTPCSWFGVICGGGSVTQLILFNNQLSGAIPPELGNLASLQTLSLNSNQLSGAIPPELGNLANLQILDLDSNQLSGAIPPELGGLANLRTLILNNNQLSGTIPPELGGLASLQTLGLSDNQLSGAIPPELGGLASLQDLLLSDNPLTGALPQSLVELGSLFTFWFNDTDLCEPPDVAFQEWLDGITDLRRTGVLCGGV